MDVGDVDGCVIGADGFQVDLDVVIGIAGVGGGDIGWACVCS